MAGRSTWPSSSRPNRSSSLPQPSTARAAAARPSADASSGRDELASGIGQAHAQQQADEGVEAGAVSKSEQLTRSAFHVVRPAAEQRGQSELGALVQLALGGVAQA